MKRILITGASGLIGSELARLLECYKLICLIRDKKKIDLSIKADYIIGDIRYDLRQFKGLEIDTIYHLAALNPLFKDKKMQREVNVEGMKNIINLARECNVKNFIYAQGMGIFDNEEITEESKRNPYTEFAKIRLEAEDILLNERGNFNICIAILGDVYGSKGWFVDMIVKRLKENRFRIPGKGDYYRSFVHVYDASNALKLLGENESNGYYIICDDHPSKFSEFVYYVADRLGVNRPGNVPEFIAKLVIGSDMLRLLTRSVKASNRKIKHELGFNLKFPNYMSGVDDILSKLSSI
ncbi:MAG: NAD(P)-dependent oxidoreductase [Candidatus Nitrosocaldaceae archaeon]